MKHKFLMMSLLILGPRQPRNDIDVYLTPIIKDLKIMWKEGVKVFDAYCQKLFTLRAILLWTTNNFPAYDNLSGYSVKGHKACLICAEDIFFVQLRHGRKTIYHSIQRFLLMSYSCRMPRKAFIGSTEQERAPKTLNGKQVYEGRNILCQVVKK